jgi:hypothetical protein
MKIPCKAFSFFFFLCLIFFGLSFSFGTLFLDGPYLLSYALAFLYYRDGSWENQEFMGRE